MTKHLPIGIQSFEEIISNDYVYVDKTRYLLDIIEQGKVFFFSRPRRFGKSLTLSTFKAIFEGKKELFKGTWIYSRYDFKPYPVIHISMSEMDTTDEKEFKKSLIYKLRSLYRAEGWEIDSDIPKMAFAEYVQRLSQRGKVVLLIDEYDKPILDSLSDVEKAARMREILRGFYVTIKDLDPYLRFVFITGISKFTKTGVFSALNNLDDISMDSEYATMLGYTQDEVNLYFEEHIEKAGIKLGVSKDAVIEKMRWYYNGFSFDGETSVYNPFSVLNFLKKRNFGEYWFESGSPSFIVNYAKNAGLNDPEMFRNVTVLNNFTTAREIESAGPESLLFQAGYLTIQEKREQTFVLGYPNYEVEQALSQLFMEEIYRIKVSLLVEATLEALDECNLELLFKTYNRVLASMPYDDFPSREDSEIKEPARKREGYYRSILLTLLLSSGIRAESERHTSLGRADIIAYRGKQIYIFELKVADNPSEKLLDHAIAQIEDKGYARAFNDGRYELVKAGVVIDDKRREVVRWIRA